MKGHTFTRRQAIRSGVAASLAAAASSTTRAASYPTTRPARSEVGNIIFMVADGMSAGVPSMTELLSRRARGRGTHWYDLQQHPETTCGYFETHSLNSPVTDSSAASSAWGSGSRIFNGALNKLPDGTNLTPIAMLVKDTRRRVGLVTTTTITHATPAGFAAVEKARSSEDEIAEQYLDRVDVLMGGGLEFFKADRRKDEKDLIDAYRDKGYAYWDHRQQVVDGSNPEKILGLFDSGHLPYAIDRQNQEKLAAKLPTLAEMTRAALNSLAPSPNGFLLQIEGGRVDHAAHANDAAALLWEQLAFDDAIGVVREFLGGHPETLVVITTDHGNANPGLRGMGSGYSDTEKCFDILAGVRASFDVLQQELKRAARDSGGARDAIVEVVRSTCGIELARKDADTVVSIVAGTLPYEANKQLANAHGLLGQILGNYTGVGFNGTKHTEDPAPVLALGAGRSQFSGLLRNTGAFVRMTGAFGIQYRNPSMTVARARAYLSQVPDVDPVHWA
ncbi:MAG TPA: alkaline phosphatase [Phycisphaerae bacterium]|nr:alkaline phosphatase [Phycisphaerae bacterium]HRY67069.1 alkaline phosphatase [Phycisphaerae bacterium]HSA29825.1 alkaline phosphatase [Phycisphaerae bacterium]